MVLCMTVNPGFGGQAFIQDVMAKVQQARQTITERDLDVDIEVDGGISTQTAPVALAAGANVFVAGHAIFRATDPVVAARELKESVGG